eukprot:6207543-Pleurochrysis_carterae.AAC.2
MCADESSCHEIHAPLTQYQTGRSRDPSTTCDRFMSELIRSPTRSDERKSAGVGGGSGRISLSGHHSLSRLPLSFFDVVSSNSCSMATKAYLSAQQRDGTIDAGVRQEFAKQLSGSKSSCIVQVGALDLDWALRVELLNAICMSSYWFLVHHLTLSTEDRERTRL